MKEYSAGGIIIKIEGDKLMVLLVEHLAGSFVFPKGHIEIGETPAAAAKREISEEVGLNDIIVGKKLGVINRRAIKSLAKPAKEITMFMIEVKNYSHHAAQESYRWFELDDVTAHLRYEEDKLFFQSIKNSLLE